MNAWLQMLWSIEVTSKLMNILCALKKNTLEFTWSKKLWSYWIISVADPHYALMLNYVHWFLRLQYDYGHQYTFCALLYQSPDTLMRNSCHPPISLSIIRLLLLDIIRAFVCLLSLFNRRWWKEITHPLGTSLALNLCKVPQWTVGGCHWCLALWWWTLTVVPEVGRCLCRWPVP